MRQSIVVRTRFTGFHCWPDAPQEVAYLRDLHRHDFHVTVHVEVGHGNRQVEFHLFKDWLNKFPIPVLQHHLLERTDLSCEQMASYLCSLINAENFKVFKVVVSEDGEYDGVFEV